VTARERQLRERGSRERPDVFGGLDHRPFVCLSDDSHPFSDEEALYAAVTTTRRSEAIPLTPEDFVDGGLPRDSYVNPWTLTSFRHADIAGIEGILSENTTGTVAQVAATYLGVEPAKR
jgi:hypothetical protein